MEMSNILQAISYKTPNILLGIGIFIVFWIFSKIIQMMIKNLLVSKNSDTNISRVLSGIIKNIIVIIGFITSLGTVGINVSAIVAGLGLTGFAFGFAFKDMLSNFISGILIFIYEPFQLGDIIIVDGKKGKVIDINLRYVTLESEEGTVLVPNSLSVSKTIEVEK
tara:strand:+ start:3113 stop:3607 length:495 start_codon:yes stop_codon:yes gene_type:complete